MRCERIWTVTLNSPDPTCSSNSAGVAFVINKELINTKSAELTILIPGRAIHLSITWHGSQKISIVNIYAPNAPSEHPPFWTEVYRIRVAKALPPQTSY
jgi:exonuclease III